MKSYTEQEIIDFLKISKTGDITDAMKLAKVKHRALDGILPMKKGETICGRVFTMVMKKLNGTEKIKYSNFQVIDKIPNKPNIVGLMTMQGDDEVISQKHHVFCGENMMQAAINKGATGIIVAGNVRDYDEIADCELPVFSMGASCKFSNLPMMWTDVDVSVEIDDVVINSGDYVLGDCDGLIFISPDDISSVVYQAEKVTKVETMLAIALKQQMELEDVVAISALKGIPRK